MKRLLLPLTLLLFSLSYNNAAIAQNSESSVAAWPEMTQTALPWTRWWWHGSAVDEENLSRCLEQYAEAGLGGVEITAIYGIRGGEDRHIDYLSPRWLEVVTHAVDEAHRLGLEVDLPPGSGWRMGGPQVPRELGNAEVRLERTQASAGSQWKYDFMDELPQAVVAYSGDQTVELTDQIDDSGQIAWDAPQAEQPWTIYIVQERLIRERVKRPAPGGEGLNINPYSAESVSHFLENFAEQIASLPPEKIRATFHDSFEYEGNWSSSFLPKFAERHGYRLEHHLPALDGEGDRETVARVKSDYRQTMSDLVHDELIGTWVDWAHKNGQLARNQSHGSPANWLDLYAACDIPETESFGPLDTGDANPLVQQFASSAAHVAGKNLVSSESATWLGEHFTVSLAEVKERLDRQMLVGVNHLFYHGTAYSPDDAAWPGWVFYASTQLNPQNPIWRDFPALNRYAARCQSWLQAGKPSNQLLIYWPIYDVWHNPRGLRFDLRVHNANRWFEEQPIGRVAEELHEKGVSFDYISDAQILNCSLRDAQIEAPGASYQAILVPAARFMPAETLAKLAEFAAAGGKVLFLDQLPESAPGLLTEEKQQAFDTTRQNIENNVAVGNDLMQLVTEAGVNPEPFYDGTAIRAIRRKLDDGWCYFLKNTGEENFNGPLEVNVDWRDAVLMDPMDGKIGRPQRDGGRLQVELAAGQTLFMRTYDHQVEAEPWQYLLAAGETKPFDGNWQITFLTGGPELPDPLTTDELKSWTELAGEAGETFAGTAAYETEFSVEQPGRYLLDLGKVADSARVVVNGEEAAVLFAPPYRLPIQLNEGENQLRIEVTNVAANRIRYLDQEGTKWRIFHDINFVNINYRPFDASDWEVRDAGLLGPVALERLEK